MAIVRVNPNLEAELTGSIFTRGPMERVLGDAADDIASVAKAIGRREYYRFGGYVGGIHAETGMSEHGELVGRVVAEDWKSHWAEWPPRQERGRRRGHILARAAQRVGFRILAGQTFGALGGALGDAVGRRAIGSGGRQAIGSSGRRAITGRR